MMSDSSTKNGIPVPILRVVLNSFSLNADGALHPKVYVNSRYVYLLPFMCVYVYSRLVFICMYGWEYICSKYLQQIVCMSINL